jgi:hypothetical protein
MTYTTLNENGAIIGSNTVTQWKWMVNAVAGSNQCILKISSYTNPDNYISTKATFVIETRTANSRNTSHKKIIATLKIFYQHNAVLSVRSSENPQVYSINGSRLPIVEQHDGFLRVHAHSGVYLVVPQHSNRALKVIPVVR